MRELLDRAIVVCVAVCAILGAVMVGVGFVATWLLWKRSRENRSRLASVGRTYT